MNNKIINRIYQKFHGVDDRKHVLLFFLTKLNKIQNQLMLVQMDLHENRLFYDVYQREELENKMVELESEMNYASSRALDCLEPMIIEVQNMIDLYLIVKDDREQGQELKQLFETKFMPMIQQISSLETLFLSKNPCIQELLFKTKLFGSTLQKVMDFEIQNEVKM